MHDTTPRLMARLADVSGTPSQVAPNGCDDCSVEPGETHRYTACPGNTTTNTAPALTAEKVAELRPVVVLFRWARRNGWSLSDSGVWQNARYRNDATIRAAFGDNVVEVSRKDDGRWPLWFTQYPVDSFRQGINVLAALDIIPAEFFGGAL